MTEMTNKGWLLLSRYLDGDLSAEQQKRVEKELRSNTALHQALEQLTHTRRVLRSVPQHKVPHSYTLTAAMLKKAERQRFPQWTWQVSSAAAAVVAVIALALQVFSPRAMVVSSAAEAAQPEMQLMAAPESADLEPTEEPQIILWNPGAIGMGGGGAEGGENYPQVAIPSAKAPSGAGFYGVGGGAPAEEAAPTEEAAAKAITESASTAAQDTAVQPEAAPQTTLSENSNPILGIAPQEERGVIQTETSQPLADEASDQGVRPIGYGEIAIIAAFVSILCAVVAFILHRKQH
jgi:hypothetical protein